MVQAVEMSHKEKVEMYQLIEKDRLIEMLIEANNNLNRIPPTVSILQPSSGNYSFVQKDTFDYKNELINLLTYCAENRDYLNNSEGEIDKGARSAYKDIVRKIEDILESNQNKKQ